MKAIKEPVVVTTKGKRKTTPPLHNKKYGTRESGSSDAYGNKIPRYSPLPNQLHFLRESEKKASHAKNYSTQDHRTLQF